MTISGRPWVYRDGFRRAWRFQVRRAYEEMIRHGAT